MPSVQLSITETYVAPQAMRLSQLASALREVLDDNFGGSHLLTAEIASLSDGNARGHCYLELVDRDPKTGDEARMRATIWASRWRVVKHYFEAESGQQLAKGMQILLEAEVAYHPTYGLSLNILGIDAGYTLGRQRLALERVLKQLKEEGLMELQQELVPEPVLQRIAVISSPTAAGYQDFVEQLRGNPAGYAFELTLFTAVMQGPDTEASVLNALGAIERRRGDFDCVAVLRGGGADQDLVAFNSYLLGKALAEFALPVLSGIGHERDTTVPDLVAYRRLKTPTAVAEWLIEQASEFDNELAWIVDAVSEAVRDRMQDEQAELAALQSAMVGHASSYLPGQATALTSLCERASAAALRTLDRHRHEVDLLAQQARLLDPKLQLKRGFAFVSDGKKAVKSARKLKDGKLILTFSDGKVEGDFRKS